jgi:hypothetical protein
MLIPGKEKSMRSSLHTMHEKVGTGWILCSVSLLIGILLLSFGHYDANRVLFYAGFCITLVGVVTGLTFLVVLKKT